MVFSKFLWFYALWTSFLSAVTMVTVPHLSSPLSPFSLPSLPSSPLSPHFPCLGSITFPNFTERSVLQVDLFDSPKYCRKWLPSYVWYSQNQPSNICLSKTVKSPLKFQLSIFLPFQTTLTQAVPVCWAAVCSWLSSFCSSLNYSPYYWKKSQP